jgi:hypothetical protein
MDMSRTRISLNPATANKNIIICNIKSVATIAANFTYRLPTNAIPTKVSTIPCTITKGIGFIAVLKKFGTNPIQYAGCTTSHTPNTPKIKAAAILLTIRCNFILFT